MASKFSNVFDSLVTRLASLYPSKTIIPYPYSLADNPNQFLVNGYGLKIGSGSNSDLTTDYSSAVDRSVSVVLTREVYGFTGIQTNLNTQIKALFDDMYDLKNDLLDLSRVSPMFNGEAIEYENDSGIEEVISGEQRFVSLEVFFSFDLTQEINQ